MKKYFITNIEYDIEDSMGNFPREGLPNNMVVEVENEDGIADYISDKTGWLVESYFNVGEVK